MLVDGNVGYVYISRWKHVKEEAWCSSCRNSGHQITGVGGAELDAVRLKHDVVIDVKV